MSQPVHPRPQLVRDRWRSLDGRWRFAFDDHALWREPAEVSFNREITVPFPPESRASGLGDEGFHPVVWYATTTRVEPEERAGRLLLHFGAVDYGARVWANGALVAEHRGGHTPFYADVTEAARGGTLEIVVRAEDDPLDLAKPRGKQDWLEKPHAIWYPRTTGIWQTVWLEPVPETRIEHLAWTPHLERWEFGLEAAVSGPLRPGLELRVRLSDNGRLLADDRYAVLTAETARRVALADPGIDDYRNDLLWSPGHPNLIGAQISLIENGAVLDEVSSYTAMRSVGVAGNRFTLNGRPYRLRMVLDQGYWPESLMAASDSELRRDVELAKKMGFNGIRKHQKVENPRWLYWCDQIGMLVWEEMPSPYRFTPKAVDRLVSEWTSVIRRDYSHPCIVAWVPFNESWGVPDLPTNPAHRDYVRALYFLTKTLDPTRPVVGNDGWEHVATDIVGVHDYTPKPEEILERYETADTVAVMLKRHQPGGRSITIPGFEATDQPVVLSEFGGIAYAVSTERGWGYSRARDPETFFSEYTGLLEAIHESRGLAGFCYTQFADTFQEKNGLLFEDRTPKVDLARLAEATRGERTTFDVDLDPVPDPFGYSKRWRERQR